MNLNRNLCHFEIQIGGDVLPPAANTVFTPCVVGDGPIQTLLGHFPPDEWDALEADSYVIVPRFAPAISAAKARGFRVYTIPLKHLGDRGAPGGGRVVLESVEDLELAPDYLAVDYPTEALPGVTAEDSTGYFEGKPIMRLVGGNFVMRTTWGDFLPLDVMVPAHDLSDGDAFIPPLPGDVGAIIVPHSGPCIRKARERCLPVLVVGAKVGDAPVPLYRVA